MDTTDEVEDSKICSKSTCSKAGERQPLSRFYRHGSSSDGHRPDCKSCHNKYRADWARKRYIRVTTDRRTGAQIELEEKGLRICNRPTCSEGGKPQPMSCFYPYFSGRSRRHVSGRSSARRPTCKKCESVYQEAIRRSRKSGRTINEGIHEGPGN